MTLKPSYVHPTEPGPRTTARGIILRGNDLLLMERWRDGLHYFSIPGGGIDEGESLEKAVVREIQEETTIVARPNRKLYELKDEAGGHTHYVFLCEYLSGEPSLPKESEEAMAGPDNRFEPKWVPVSRLPEINFNYWKPIQKLLIEDLKNGFSESVKITAV